MRWLTSAAGIASLCVAIIALSFVWAPTAPASSVTSRTASEWPNEALSLEEAPVYSPPEDKLDERASSTPLNEDTEATGDGVSAPQEAQDAYCTIFSDPSECEQQAERGVMKYWTAAEVRQELWKTMNALTELDLREAEGNKKAKKRAVSDAKTFKDFAEAMTREVAEIHKAQEDMHVKHTAAFDTLVDQLLNATTAVHELIDSATNKTHARITADKMKEEEDHRQVLKQLMDKMNQVNRRIEALHKESNAATNVTRAYAEQEEQAMKAGDEREKALLDALNSEMKIFDVKEGGDFTAVTQALEAAEQKQAADNAQLHRLLDAKIAGLRGNASAVLDEERTAIRKKLRLAFSTIQHAYILVGQVANERIDRVYGNVTQMIAEQTANNAQQQMYINRLRSDFNRDAAAALRRLDAADSRLDAAFAELSAANKRLQTEAKTDKDFLLDSLQSQVQHRDAEALAQRTWANQQTNALDASLAHTTKTLGPTMNEYEASLKPFQIPVQPGERVRLIQQRNADMEAMPGVISGAVGTWRDGTDAQMDADKTEIHALLTQRMHEAGEALRALGAQMAERNTQAQQKFDNMHRLQVDKNAIQQQALDQLQHDSWLEHELSLAHSAALNGNITGIAARLKTIKKEITGMAARDRVDILAKVDSDFTGTQLRLDSDMNRSHTRLWDRLKNEWDGGIVASFADMKARSLGRESSMLRFSDGIADDQRQDTRFQKAQIDQIDRAEKNNEDEIDTKASILLKQLHAVKTRLSMQLAHISVQERHDDADIQRQVVADNNKTESALNSDADVLQAEMKTELKTMLHSLTTTLETLKKKEQSDHLELVSNLSAWDQTQQATNLHQRQWLQTLTDVCEDSSKGIGGKIKALREALVAADNQLTTHGTALEKHQRDKVKKLSQTLTADLATMKTDQLDFISRTGRGVNKAIDDSLSMVRLQLNSLNTSAANTKTWTQEAIEAMAASITAHEHTRRKEVAAIVANAAKERAAFEGKIESILEQIAKDKRNVHTQLRKSKTHVAAHRDSVEAFIDTSILNSSTATTAAQDIANKALAQMLSNAVGEWTKQLEDARASSEREASEIAAALTTVKSRQSEHNKELQARMVALLSAVKHSEDATDVAIDAMNATLQQEDSKLTEMDRLQRQAQQDDAARIRSTIHEGLDGLRVKMKISMKELNSSTTAKIKSKAESLAAQLRKIRANMLAREMDVRARLISLINKQEAESARHQDQITNLTRTQTKLKNSLHAAIDHLNGALRIDKQRLTLRQGKADHLGAQELIDLADKLTRAESELNSASLDTASAEDKSMLAAKSALGQTKAILSQMHVALLGEQQTDTLVIKKEVSTGIQALQDRLSAAIQEAEQKIRVEFNSKLAELDGRVTSIKSKLASSDQELHAKIAALSEAEQQHDSAQNALLQHQVQVLDAGETSVEKTRRALTTNATLVSNYVNKRLKALTASLATVKPQVLPEVESSVALARRALEKIIRQTKDELSAAVKGRLRATEANIQAEKEAEEAKERLLGASIHQMSQGDQHFEAEWQDSLNTIDDTLQRLRAASHRNNSEIDATFAAEEAEFQKKQHAIGSHELRAADRLTFSQRELADTGLLKSNFSDDIEQEILAVNEAMSREEYGIKSDIPTAFNGPEGSENDLRRQVNTLDGKLDQEFAIRAQQIGAVNSTDEHELISLEHRIARFAEGVGDAVDTSKDMLLRSRQRLDRIKTRLASLLDTAAQLSSMKSQVAAIEENQGSETHREDSDYSGVGQSASQITTDIAGWRSKLTRAIASMNTALEAEALKRKETGQDVGKQLEAAIARMERVQEVSCKLVQKSFNDVFALLYV